MISVLTAPESRQGIELNGLKERLNTQLLSPELKKIIKDLPYYLKGLLTVSGLAAMSLLNSSTNPNSGSSLLALAPALDPKTAAKGDYDLGKPVCEITDFGDDIGVDGFPNAIQDGAEIEVTCNGKKEKHEIIYKSFIFPKETTWLSVDDKEYSGIDDEIFSFTPKKDMTCDFNAYAIWVGSGGKDVYTQAKLPKGSKNLLVPIKTQQPGNIVKDSVNTPSSGDNWQWGLLTPTTFKGKDVYNFQGILNPIGDCTLKNLGDEFKKMLKD
jgi:hypothetical protein